MSLNEMFARMAPGNIATIAGVGYVVEGVPAREAPAGWPMGIARNAAGDLFVIDYWGHRIWRIDVDSVLHSYAGQGVPGNSGDGGPAARPGSTSPPTAAGRSTSQTCTLDTLHHQADRRLHGHRHHHSGQRREGRGGEGGPAVEAELDTHCGIAIDGDGNVYISSEWANNIRRIDARTGIIDRFAGWTPGTIRRGWRQPPGVGPKPSAWAGTTATAARRISPVPPPEHLAFDSRGDLYVCDNSNHRIRKIDMESGTVTTVFGNGQAASNGDGGPAVEASVFMPDAIYVDAPTTCTSAKSTASGFAGWTGGRAWSRHSSAPARRASGEEGMPRPGDALQLLRGRTLGRP